MFGVGTGEIIFILFIILMVFGADKVPEMARKLGKTIRSVRNATNDMKSEFTKVKEKNPQMESKEVKDLKEEATKVKQDIEKITGSIKRKL